MQILLKISLRLAKLYLISEWQYSELQSPHKLGTSPGTDLMSDLEHGTFETVKTQENWLGEARTRMDCANFFHFG